MAAPALIVSLRCTEVFMPNLSVTVTVATKVPLVLGLPEIFPLVAPIDRPGGRPAAVHLYGKAPPLARTWVAYVVCTRPWLTEPKAMARSGWGRTHRC